MIIVASALALESPRHQEESEKLSPLNGEVSSLRYSNLRSVKIRAFPERFRRLKETQW